MGQGVPRLFVTVGQCPLLNVWIKHCFYNNTDTSQQKQKTKKPKMVSVKFSPYFSIIF